MDTYMSPCRKLAVGEQDTLDTLGNLDIWDCLRMDFILALKELEPEPEYECRCLFFRHSVIFCVFASHG